MTKVIVSQLNAVIKTYIYIICSDLPMTKVIVSQLNAVLKTYISYVVTLPWLRL